MAGEYDLMLSEDRDQKLADFENKRREWVEVRRRGKARFILFDGLLRSALFNFFWGVFSVGYLHLSVATAVKVTVFILLANPIFNLLDWQWRDRRFVTRARLQPGQTIGR